MGYPYQNVRMPKITVNGWDFDYTLTGEGPDIVFIHGEIHGSAYFKRQIDEFSKGYRCLTYNRRGHKGTGAPAYGYSLENQRRDLEGLIEALRIENPIIVAVAFGATIAADYAINHSDRVRGIVLVAWSELHDARKYFDRWAYASEQVVTAYEQGGRDGMLDYLCKEAGHSIYFVINADSPIREECIQWFGCHPIEEYKHGMLEFALSVPDLIAPFSKLETPVLGICGSEDPFPDEPERLTAMKNFREDPPINGAGRFVHWERAEEFNAKLRAFFEELH